MTTWQEDLQRASAAGFAAWGGLVEASTRGYLGMWATVVDWAVNEQVVAPPNASAVPVHADQLTTLHARFHRADDPDRTPIAAGLITCDPPVLPAMPPGATHTVVVHVSPGPGPGAVDPPMADAGYVGHLYDDRGVQLTPVPVYVAVHVPWSA